VEYITEGRRFDWSYVELRDTYHIYCALSDDEFMAKLDDILHFAVFVCFVKEIPTYVCLADTGIVHELVHLLRGSSGSTTSLKEVRKLFEEQLKLA
jgi:hypothetical protein